MISGSIHTLKEIYILVNKHLKTKLTPLSVDFVKRHGC